MNSKQLFAIGFIFGWICSGLVYAYYGGLLW